jgi:hypothetical protein
VQIIEMIVELLLDDDSYTRNGCSYGFTVSVVDPHHCTACLEPTVLFQRSRSPLGGRLCSLFFIIH